MRFDRRLLGWGAFFILLGAIPLAVQQGYLDRDLVSRWFSLWPLLLIGWGLGLLLRETPIEWLGGAVTTLTFGIMGGSFIATGLQGGVPFSFGCGNDNDSQPFAEQRGTLAPRTSLSVTLPCGELTIVPVDGADWTVGGMAGEEATPEIKTTSEGVEISAPDRVGFWSGGRADWQIGLPRETEDIGLSVTLNAGKGRVALDGLRLASLSFTLNAGELTVRASDTAALRSAGGTINAGSATVTLPAALQADFTVNAGSLTICLPEGAEVHVDTAGALGSNNLDELGLEPIGNDWQTPGYDTAASKVMLSVTTNAGSFDLSIGGTCGA